MTKRKGNPPAKPTDEGNTLRVTSLPDEQSATLAKTVLRPSVRAAVTAVSYSKQFGPVNLDALVNEFVGQISAVNGGDMRRPEGMLVAQSHTLESLFHELVRRATVNMGEHLGAAETYMRLALKAQAQCRATIETLAMLKNPAQVTFVRQANVAHGPQQVNNGAKSVAEFPRARETENPPNKLLEQQHGERVDGGTAKAAVGANSPQAAMGEVNRTAD